MVRPPESEAEASLRAHLGGERTGTLRISQLVYDELRRLAAAQMRGERPEHTLQPTALVNEALSRLIQAELDSRSRAEFLRIAARTMRRVLIDHARARLVDKRAADRRIDRDLLDIPSSSNGDPLDVLALEEALEKLARLSSRQAEVVELRFFCGLSLREVGATLGVSRDTAKEHWTLARAWLNRELTRGADA